MGFSEFFHGVCGFVFLMHDLVSLWAIAEKNHRCFFMRSPSLASMEVGSTPTSPWAPTQV